MMHAFSMRAIPCLLSAFCFSNSLRAQPGVPVLFEDFETVRADGLYASLLAHRLLDIASGRGVGGGTALRATYVGNNQGSERIVVNYGLPQPLLEATLNFDVKFEAGFQFVRGGKLHGFFPENGIAGGNPIEPDGWSTKLMWGSGGSVANYTYHQDMEGTFGEGGQSVVPFRFEPDRYHAMSYHVKVNDPPSSSNGFFHVYIDGKLVTRQDNLRLRAVGGENTTIYQVTFNTFHGGQSTSWAPKNPDGSYATVYALFDNFAVTKGLAIRRFPGEAPPVTRLAPAHRPRLWFDGTGNEPVFRVDGRLLMPTPSPFIR